MSVRNLEGDVKEEEERGEEEKKGRGGKEGERSEKGSPHFFVQVYTPG